MTGTAAPPLRDKVTSGPLPPPSSVAFTTMPVAAITSTTLPGHVTVSVAAPSAATASDADGMKGGAAEPRRPRARSPLRVDTGDCVDGVSAGSSGMVEPSGYSSDTNSVAAGEQACMRVAFSLPSDVQFHLRSKGR